MRKLLYILPLLFIAFTFQSDSPPGWYQVPLPVNDFINDIFFIDSLNGWAVTKGHPQENDTGYILHTTNGGDNWNIQFNHIDDINVIQFLDESIGYGGGGFGRAIIFKTTNGGVSWDTSRPFGAGVVNVNDLQFINKDTGWFCSNDIIGGGLFRTTNGGINWGVQLVTSTRPTKLFFINKDTGWAATNSTHLLKTTNGGQNWIDVYTFPQQINDIYFINSDNGIVASGTNHISTDGGFTWIASNMGGIKLSFANDTVGWAGNNLFNIRKTTDGGITWGNQTTNISNPSVSAINNLTAWAGGSGIVHTTDGGGPVMSIEQISSQIPLNYQLYQNYPNPFNPVTKIKYEIKQRSEVKLIVYDNTGRIIANLVNETQPSGVYLYTFEGELLPSGIYYYRLIVDNKSIDTKKMVLVK